MTPLADGERLLPLGGVRQWVRVQGAAHGGVPLVVVHGGPGGHHYVFERTAGPLLARERMVVYHEQRGCGRSEAPADPGDYRVPVLLADLDALLDALGGPAVDLLGYSFGGGLVLAYARSRPGRVRRVVAQAPVLDLNDARLVAGQLAGFARVASPAARPRVEEALAADAPPAERLRRVWAVADRDTVDAFLFEDARHAARNRAWWQESGLVNTGLLHEAVRHAPLLDEADLAHVPAEALVLLGRHDRNVPLAVIEGAAHFPDVEAPEEYARTVLGFLA